MAKRKKGTRQASTRKMRKTIKAATKKSSKKEPRRRTGPKRSAPLGDELIWSPPKFALRYQRWSTSNAATSILLSHPTAPFPSAGLLVDAIDDNMMQELGLRYIIAVSENLDIHPPLDLPPRWIDALRESGRNSVFGWLPLGWPPKDPEAINAGDPFVSFQAQRFAADGTLLPDQTVILFASEWINFDGKPAVAGSEFGIRVVAHALRHNGRFQIRITGLTASIPSGSYRTQGLSTTPRTTLASVEFVRSTLADVKTEMAREVGLMSDDVSLRGVRLAMLNDGPQLEWRASSRPTTRAYTHTTPYFFVFRGKKGGAGSLVSKVELVADATGDAYVFPLDPSSQAKTTPLHERRPTRDGPWLDESPPDSLDFLRYPETIAAGQLLARLAVPPLPLPPEMEVVVCPGFVVADNPPGVAPGSIKVVNLPGTGLDAPPALSNEFAAISAFNNVREFFQRLAAYGLGGYPYFRIARLPLKLYYRSGTRPGPGKDGQTVNARVLPEGWDPDFVGPTAASQRPILQMHLALADLSTRRRDPWNGVDRAQAEPLGIAADARWIWHEIGHVLLMASVGELEFRFAHSAGDALAAIVADPQSALAADPNWRGATFPWVFIPRRHDRCVSLGWGWSGALHYAMSQVPDATLPRRKGYWTEQILSSSLFRLYRCLGGDTKSVGPPGGPGESARESASHYCVYLIMKGIQILGTSGVVLANEPEQFVCALKEADMGTGAWNVSWNLQWDVLRNPPPPAPVHFQFNRVGGCAWKVIRWAFEAQGMYNDPGTITNAPGLPPSVDVYIEDLRPTTEVTPYGSIEYGPGGYVPVSLDWDSNQIGSGPTTPLWQADPANVIHVVGNNISVQVRNRGSQVAANVQVSVWWRAWPMGGPAPQWGNPSTPWTACNPQPSAGKNIAPGGQVLFGPFAFAPPPAGTRYIVLAQATCPDDKANTDPSTLLPCSLMPTPLVDLVANDNNLGLVVIGP